MINFKGCVALVGVLYLASCAPMATRDGQYVAVNTKNHRGAICTLTNNVAQWQIDSTPGSVIVDRDSSDLVVSCLKNNLTGKQVVKPKLRGTILKDEMTGEVSAVMVKPESTHSYSYPENITVMLKPSVK